MDDCQKIIDILSRCKRVLVTTHVRPDGDALGSTAAMIMGLRQKGIDAKALLLSHLPRKYSFVYEENAIDFFDVESGWPADFSFDAYDAVLVLDTGTWSQLPGLRERGLESWSRPKIVIDHHLTQQAWAEVKLVNTASGSCGEIIEEFLTRWGVKMDARIASALFLAIVSDTGWFQYSNTRAQTLRLSAALIDAGVDVDRMYRRLYRSERAERVALHARGAANMELLDNGRVAIIKLRREDFAATRSSDNDTEDQINIPLQIRTVEVSVLLTEPPDGKGPIRASFRSKGAVDVAKMAEQFGGGGHARASGAKFDGETIDRVAERISTALSASSVARQVP